MKLFPTQAECLFVSVLISSVDGSSIDDAINKKVSKERFSQTKQDMLKLINIINNYIVFLLAQIIVPFLQQDYFPSFERVHILKVLVALLVQSTIPLAIACLLSLITVYTLRDEYVQVVPNYDYDSLSLSPSYQPASPASQQLTQ